MSLKQSSTPLARNGAASAESLSESQRSSWSASATQRASAGAIRSDRSKFR